MYYARLVWPNRLSIFKSFGIGLYNYQMPTLAVSAVGGIPFCCILLGVNNDPAILVFPSAMCVRFSRDVKGADGKRWALKTSSWVDNKGRFVY